MMASIYFQNVQSFQLIELYGFYSLAFHASDVPLPLEVLEFSVFALLPIAFAFELVEEGGHMKIKMWRFLLK